MCKTWLNLIWPTVRCDRFPFQAVESVGAGVLAAQCVDNFVTFFQIGRNYASWTSKQMWLCELEHDQRITPLPCIQAIWKVKPKVAYHNPAWRVQPKRCGSWSLPHLETILSYWPWEISCLARCTSGTFDRWFALLMWICDVGFSYVFVWELRNHRFDSSCKRIVLAKL